jgi:hypothetical protein
MKEKYDYCIINLKRGEVVLYDQDKYYNVSPLFDEAIITCNVSFDEHNNLVIEGEPLIYEISIERTKVDELEHKPCKRFVNHYEPGKIARLFGAKPYDYVKGWWAYVGKTPVKYILSKYIIKLL